MTCLLVGPPPPPAFFIQDVLTHGSGLRLEEFLFLLNHFKKRHVDRLLDADPDLVDAFVAMGGNQDRSGTVHIDTLRQMVDEFHLDVDMDMLVGEITAKSKGPSKRLRCVLW